MLQIDTMSSNLNASATKLFRDLIKLLNKEIADTTNDINIDEKLLLDFDEVLIYGYSCPSMDFETSNLILRSFHQNKKDKKISVIDPNINILKRYSDLADLKKIHYYRHGKFFP